MRLPIVLMRTRRSPRWRPTNNATPSSKETLLAKAWRTTAPLGSHCRRRVLVSDNPLLVCRQPHVNLMQVQRSRVHHPIDARALQRASQSRRRASRAVTLLSPFIGTSDDLLHLRPGRRVHVLLSDVGGRQGSSETTWLKCAGQSPLSFALTRIEELSGRDTPLTSYLYDGDRQRVSCGGGGLWSSEQTTRSSGQLRDVADDLDKFLVHGPGRPRRVRCSTTDGRTNVAASALPSSLCSPPSCREEQQPANRPSSTPATAIRR